MNLQLRPHLFSRACSAPATSAHYMTVFPAVIPAYFLSGDAVAQSIDGSVSNQEVRVQFMP